MRFSIKKTAQFISITSAGTIIGGLIGLVPAAGIVAAPFVLCKMDSDPSACSGMAYITTFATGPIAMTSIVTGVTVGIGAGIVAGITSNAYGMSWPAQYSTKILATFYGAHLFANLFGTAFSVPPILGGMVGYYATTLSEDIINKAIVSGFTAEVANLMPIIDYLLPDILVLATPLIITASDAMGYDIIAMAQNIFFDKADSPV